MKYIVEFFYQVEVDAESEMEAIDKAELEKGWITLRRCPVRVDGHEYD